METCRASFQWKQIRVLLFLLPALQYPSRTAKMAAWVAFEGEKIVLSAPACCLALLCATSLAKIRCFHLEIA